MKNRRMGLMEWSAVRDRLAKEEEKASIMADIGVCCECGAQCRRDANGHWVHVGECRPKKG